MPDNLKSLPNAHIAEYLQHYRNLESPDFAVMVSGSWGSGKTHFVKTLLPETTPDSEHNHIWISLNGMSSTADIDLVIYQTLHPIMGSKGMLFAKKVVTSSLRAGLRINFDVDGDGKADGFTTVGLPQIDYGDFSKKLEGCILIFDDVERCGFPVEEAFGCINAFVENSSVPVVLISDEAQLSKKCRSYDKIKEKVIGRTFQIESALEVDFDTIVDIGMTLRTKRTVEKERNEIIKTLTLISEQTGKHNFRSLRHTLRDFDFFWSNVATRLQTNNTLASAFFRVFLILSYNSKIHEFDIKELSKESLEDARVEYYRRHSNPGKGDNPPKPTRLEIVLKRHNLGLHWPLSLEFDLILPTDVWHKIFLAAQVDQETITQAFEESRFCEETQPAWKKLWYWRRLEDEEAKEVLKAVSTDLENHRYTKIQEVFHVFSMFIGLREMKVLKDSYEQIISRAETYTQEIADMNLLEHELASGGWFEDSYAGLGFWALSRDESESLRVRIKKIFDDYVSKRLSLHATEKLNEIAQYPSDFYSSLEARNELLGAPIFVHIKPANFLLQFEKLPNISKWSVSDILRNRIQANYRELWPELDFYQRLAGLLSEKIQTFGEETTPSKEQLIDFKEVIEQIAQSILDQKTAEKHRLELQEKELEKKKSKDEA